MKTKLEMAHDYLRDIVSNWEYDDSFDPVAEAWKYADAMQAESDKREKEESAQRRKEIREMLNAPNTFVEREGQHFDDFCSDEIQAQRDAKLYGTGFLKVTYDSDGVKYKRLDPKTISVCSSNIGLDSQVLKEWQPDWSQAPEWAKYLTIDSLGIARFWDYEPTKTSASWFIDDDVVWRCEETTIFNYKGDWRNSLRKRPK